MLAMDDERWVGLKGGYRMPIDTRILIKNLESGVDDAAAWDALWEELHHQGDVGEASYATVPHLVRIYRESGTIDWRTYAIVSTIELARTESGNPEIPAWMRVDYFQALDELAELGTEQILKASDQTTSTSILGLIAIVKNLRVFGKLLSHYSEEEILEIKQGWEL